MARLLRCGICDIRLNLTLIDSGRWRQADPKEAMDPKKIYEAAARVAEAKASAMRAHKAETTSSIAVKGAEVKPGEARGADSSEPHAGVKSRTKRWPSV